MNKPWRHLQILPAVLLFVFGLSSDSSAQCDPNCMPPKVGPTFTQYFHFDPGFPEWGKTAWRDAQAEWNSHLAAVNAGARIFEDGGRRVSVNEAYRGTNVWAEVVQNDIYINPDVLDQPYEWQKFIALHEFGHTLNYDHVLCAQDQTVMAEYSAPYWAAPSTYLKCPDDMALERDFGSGGGGSQGWCVSKQCTPIIVNLDGGTLKLSDRDVPFDFAGSGIQQYFSWTRAGTNTAFLVLDRNGNGRIDNGHELFGNFTPIGWGSGPLEAADGYEALGSFDSASNGGNADGWITAADSVYPMLRLWFDNNHNGVTEEGELRSLLDVGVVGIKLSATESLRRDRNGNWFRYCSDVLVQSDDDRLVRRTACDVYLNPR